MTREKCSSKSFTMMSFKKLPLPQSTFLRYYILLVTVSNLFTAIWTIFSDSMGIYIAFFFLVPLNLLFMLLGLIGVVFMQIKKYPISYWQHYLLVILTPVAAQLIATGLINAFAPNVGC